jgi:hypothetical protein
MRESKAMPGGTTNALAQSLCQLTISLSNQALAKNFNADGECRRAGLSPSGDSLPPS